MTGFARTSIMVVAVCVGQAAGQVSTAEACGCVQAGFQLLSPAPGETAPLNAMVRVGYEQTWRPEVSVELRQSGHAVRAVARVLGTGQWRVIELDPVGPLVPNQSYDVVAREGGVSPSETVVGGFSTGTRIDADAPTWTGIRRAVVVKHRKEAARCVPRDRYAVLYADAAVDPTTPDRSVLYAVWTANAKGLIDTEAPPVTYVQLQGGRLALGAPDGCARSGLVLPRKGSLSIAVAAVDEAGNRSEAKRVKLPISRALARAP